MASIRKDSLITGAVLLLIILLMGAFVWYSSYQERQAAFSQSPGGSALAGDNTFTTLEGEVIPSLVSDEVVTVVYVWASWCPQCKDGLSNLGSVASEYDSDIRFLAINRNEATTTAERFLRTVPNTDNLQLVVDTRDRFYDSAGGYAMPELVVFAPDGSEIARQRGILDLAALRETLDTNTE